MPVGTSGVRSGAPIQGVGWGSAKGAPWAPAPDMSFPPTPVPCLTGNSDAPVHSARRNMKHLGLTCLTVALCAVYLWAWLGRAKGAFMGFLDRDAPKPSDPPRTTSSSLCPEVWPPVPAFW